MSERNKNGLHVLVVDDEVDLRRDLRARFDEVGWEVSTAATVEQAQELIGKRDYHAYVVDMHLSPGSSDEIQNASGTMLIRQLRESRSEVPVIATSERFLSWTDAVAGFDLGVDDYVRLPMMPEEIVARVEARVLHRLQEGLFLYFSTPLAFLDRVLVEGIVHAKNCRVVEFKELGGGSAMVRLAGAPRAELEAVAEALWNRVWQTEQESLLSALAVTTGSLHADLRSGLDDLVARLDRIELRLPTDDTVEMLTDQGAQYVKEKYEKLFQTGLQRTVKLVRKWGTKKVLGEIEAEVAAVLRAGLGSRNGDKDG